MNTQDILQGVRDWTNTNNGAYDISAKTGDTYLSLSNALANVPNELRRGGMSIKFIQLTPAKYTVVKTEGIVEQPTGTEVQEALSLESGTYTAAQMTGVTPPESGSVTYYLAVTETVDEQEVTTYITWVITKATSDVQKYVQYRLMATAWSTTVADWQGVDDVPTMVSKNLIESGAVNSINGLNCSEIELTFETGGWYTYNYQTKSVGVGSGSAKRTSFSANTGFYILQAKNSGSRLAFIVDENGDLIVRYAADSLSNRKVVFVPKDNCTVYLSSTSGSTVRAWKVGSFTSYKEGFFNDGIPYYGINRILLSWTTGYYCNKNSNNKVILSANGDYMYCQILNCQKGIYFFMGRPTTAHIYTTDADGNIVQDFSPNENDYYSLAVPSGGGIHLTTKPAYINAGLFPYLYKMGLFDDSIVDIVLNTSSLVDIADNFNALENLIEISSSLVSLAGVSESVVSSFSPIVTTLDTWTSGGYFNQGSKNPTSGSGYYMQNVDVEGYDEIEIVYGSVSSTSARFSNVFDKDWNLLKTVVDRDQQTNIFHLDKRAKYLCVSSYYSSTVVKLKKYTIDNHVDNVMDKVELTTNPLANIDRNPSFIRCFKQITCIGDSLTAGTFNINNSDSTVTIRDYGYPAMLQKLTGVTTINMGQGGMTASRDGNRSWFDYMVNNDIWNPATEVGNDKIGDCIIIALGTNDITQNGFDGDVSTDIDVNDRNNNALTAVGGYANIIQAVKEVSPKTKIFCVSISNERNSESTRTAANQKIKAIAEFFSCYYLDFQAYAENTVEEAFMFINYYKNNSHNNALGYNVRARQLATYIDWIIASRIAEFQQIQFIGTDYQY